MNKIELINHVAKSENLTKAQAAEAVDRTFQAIMDKLATGEQVMIVGFGAFEVKRREVRTGRNPRTGEPMQVGGGMSPVFRPGRPLKEAVKKLS